LKPVNAVKDFLTNCYARDGILPFLKKMEEEYLAHKKPFSILIMDVDHFKSFNDKYGHLMGDEVLKYFSSSMRLDLEDQENAPFRFGGDEFIMVFPNKTPADAFDLASRLRKNIRTRSCLIKGKQITITFSGGIAGYPSDASSIEEILDRADKALYYSKNHGRSRITKFSDLGWQEAIQIAAIFAVLALLGGGLYYYRDTLAPHVGKAEATLGNLIPHAPVTPTMSPAPSPRPGGGPATPVPTAPTVPGISVPTPDSDISKIYLESGRIVTGVIKSEDEDAIKVEVGLREGKGTLQLKKSQILRIETGSKPPKKLN
jgi:diguanylate cyclase (GGDEF)-like protein